jgi:uncharacterized protein (DUF1330 family)
VAPLLARTGARVLVASPSVDVREGVWEANWTVVIEFPYRAAAMPFTSRLSTSRSSSCASL